MSSSNNGNEEEKSFSCRIEDMRILGDLIGCLYTDISKDTECAIEATPDNICFKVSGKGRSCQVILLSPCCILNFTFRL